MPDNVFPQSNSGGTSADFLSEDNLTQMLAAAVGFKSGVDDGLGVSGNFVDNTIDVSAGVAVIVNGGSGYVVAPESRSNISLPAVDGLNHVFLTTDINNNDDVSIHVDSDDTPPTTPSLKLAVVDTANNTVTLRNRSSGGGGGVDIEDDGDLVGSGISNLNFRNNFLVDDDGDETFSLDALDTRIPISNDGNQVSFFPQGLDFRGDLSASGDGAGGVVVNYTGSGGSGSGGFTDSGSLILEAAGTDNNTYDLPVYVPDGLTISIDELGLSLEDNSTDTNVSVRLLDPSGTVAGSRSLDSHPVFDTAPGISYTNSSGSLQRAVIQVINEGSTNYGPQFAAADSVEFTLKWSVA